MTTQRDGGAGRRGPRGMARTAIAGSLLLVLALASGCALPGYRSDFTQGNAWYDFGGDEQTNYEEYQAGETTVEYDPVVLPITPRLISHQQTQRAQRQLDPAQQAVTAAGQGIEYEKSARYEIGRGDVLEVIVYGHPELGQPQGANTGMIGNSPGGGGSIGRTSSASGHLVDVDGDIFFPYVGETRAAGLTIKELRRNLAKSLSSYIRQPQVDVRVRQYRSQEVYISGDIAKPCTVSITDVTLTVLQALDRCDTLQASIGRNNNPRQASGVGVQNVTLIRDGKATELDLNQVYATGQPIPLKTGDRLLVDDSANRVFMVGEFTEQTALPYSTGGMALSDAIADAGGVSLGTADTSAIYVIRGFVSGQPAEDGGLKTTVRPKVYELDAGSPSGLLLANQFQLQPRDVVFAAPASLVNFNRALAQLTPSLDILFRSFLIYDRSSRRKN